jgi:uroporphyrinogen-III synthase
MKYYILIRFQGQEYRSLESYDSVSAAYDEAHKRFDHGGVQWDVFTDESTI